MYGLNPATGAVRQQASIGAQANHFPTPSVGDGLLLAPTARDVVAFRAGSGFAVPAAPPPSTPAAGQPAPSGGAGTSPGVIAGVVAGCAAVIAGVGWFLWRRRTAGRR
jgi:hypothetical protein